MQGREGGRGDSCCHRGLVTRPPESELVVIFDSGGIFLGSVKNLKITEQRLHIMVDYYANAFKKLLLNLQTSHHYQK